MSIQIDRGTGMGTLEARTEGGVIADHVDFLADGSIIGTCYADGRRVYADGRTVQGAPVEGGVYTLDWEPGR